MSTLIRLHPEFERKLAEKMIEELSGEIKLAYTETLEKVGSEKTIKMILHDRGVRKVLDLNDPAHRRYTKRIMEKMLFENHEQVITASEFADIFQQFIRA